MARINQVVFGFGARNDPELQTAVFGQADDGVSGKRKSESGRR